MCIVGTYDISSMFPHICLHHYLLIIVMFTYPFYLRAHTSFMLSSGWTSSPSQVLARGRTVFSLAYQYSPWRPSRGEPRILSWDCFSARLLVRRLLHFCTYRTCIILLSWVYFQLG